MDGQMHAELIQRIVGRSPTTLEDLGLAGPPSREQILADIEEKMLLPKDRLPSHWLPHYQM